jgi:MFS family permease
LPWLRANRFFFYQDFYPNSKKIQDKPARHHHRRAKTCPGNARAGTQFSTDAGSVNKGRGFPTMTKSVHPMPPQKRPEAGHLRVFSTLFLAVFSVTLGVGLVVPLLPLFAHELGATGLLIGLIFGAFSLSRTAFLPFFGRLSDLKGRKPFVTIGLLAYFLVSIAFAFTEDVCLFIVIRFVQGIASAMILPVAQAYVGEITPQGKEGFTMGLFNLSIYAGLSLGPVMGGAVKDFFGIQTSFLAMGLIALVGCLLCLFLLPPRKEERPLRQVRRPILYRILVRNRYVGALFVFRFTFTTCIGMVWSFLPLLAGLEFQLSSSAVGVLVMLGVLTTGLLQTPMGLLADRFNKRIMIIAGGIVAAGAIWTFLHAKGFWGLFMANLLFGVGGGIAMPAVMAMTVIIGHHTTSMGSIMGLLTMGHSLGMLIGPILAGLMMDTFELGLAFVAGTIIMALGVVLVIVFTSGFRDWADGNYGTA